MNRKTFITALAAAASAAVEEPRASKQDRDDPLYREFLLWRANRLNSKR